MLKESISGVRGIVGKDLTSDLIADYCQAFSEFLPEGPIVIARDSRPHGEAISNLVASLLRLAGRDIIDIGIQATPTAEVVTERTKAAGGIIITASHNPIEWNALKFIKSDGLFLNSVEFNKLLTLKKQRLRWANYDKVGKYEFLREAEKYHIDSIIWLPWLEAQIIREANFKVVFDANGGTGAVAMFPLMEKLGCEVIPLCCEPNGIFEHEPEPRPVNLGSLCELVTANKADIGLATDPDADRLALVDEKGNAIGEEYTLAIGAAEVTNYIDGPIVINLSTSAMVESLGKEVLRTQVGEINVAIKMLEVDSPVGGEGNGGLIVPACHPGRDGILAAAVILHRMARTGKTLSQLASEFPKLHMIKDRTEASIGYAPLEGLLKDAFKVVEIDRTDGVRIGTDDGWLHVRASNTEPIMRLIAESESEKRTREMIDRAKKLIEG